MPGWFRRAAERGHLHSQYLLGQAYYDGDEGAIRDRAEAAAWFDKAAERGHFLAQHRLSGCYWFGEGVSRDVVQSYAWHNLSVRHSWGVALADLLVAKEEKMSSIQIEEA